MKLKSLTHLYDNKFSVDFDVGTFELVVTYSKSKEPSIEAKPEFWAALEGVTETQKKYVLSAVKLMADGALERLQSWEQFLNEQYGTFRWFGDSWGAPICNPEVEIDTPVGEFCARCGGQVRAGDRGITLPFHKGIHDPVTREPYHLQCFKESVGIG
jgi:hypothetical protein